MDNKACNKCDSEGEIGMCAVAAHANCFIMCSINPDDPIWDGK